MDYAWPVCLTMPSVARFGGADRLLLSTRGPGAFWKSSALALSRQNRSRRVARRRLRARAAPSQTHAVAVRIKLHEAGAIRASHISRLRHRVPVLRNESGSASSRCDHRIEGVVGTSLLVGEGVAQTGPWCKARHAYRLSANRLRREFECGGYLCHLLLPTRSRSVTQMAQTALCNRYHSIEQRLCRWLLLSLDRVTTNELSLTHELLSNILGVRREASRKQPEKLQKSRGDSLCRRTDYGAEIPWSWKDGCVMPMR